MTDGEANSPFRIGPWLVQPDMNRLSDGELVVALEPRVMAVLVCLASNPRKTVSPEELLGVVWAGRVHDDNTIYQAIAHLRKALGDDVQQPHFVETIAKKGYRLICPVIAVAEDSVESIAGKYTTAGSKINPGSVAMGAVVISLALAFLLILNPKLLNRPGLTPEGPREKSVVVLPFVDVSTDGSQQYLGDGITEELIHLLSNVPDLRVVERTSSFSFRDRNDDARSIGRELNVATVLEGSIRKDGDRIRITTQLIDARDGDHLWSKTFDRDKADIFSIRDEIAAAVATTFEYQATDLFATPTDNASTMELRSYEFYLLGQHHLRKNTKPNAKIAVEYFELAIEMEPGFSRAYAGLSQSYASLSPNGDDPQLLRKAQSAAEFALSLDDQSAEAFVALGRTKLMQRDHIGADDMFLRAIELNPNDAQAYVLLSGSYYLQGRKSEANELVRHALNLNPMSGELITAMGYAERSTSGWESALVYFEKAIQRDPDYPGSYNAIGHHYYSTGQLDRAIPYVKKLIELGDGEEKVAGAVVALASIYVDLGEFDAAENLIRGMRAVEPDHVGTTNVDIHLQLARGNVSAARDLVHRAAAMHVDNNAVMSFLAIYETILEDDDHAKEIYSQLEKNREFENIYGDTNLYRGSELMFGVLGAVNLAYVQNNGGNFAAAQDFLSNAEDFIESRSHPSLVAGSFHVLAQIAAINDDADSALEYFEQAVNAGWTKAWFARIDPIMKNMRKDDRYQLILDNLEDNVRQMRSRSKLKPSI